MHEDGRAPLADARGRVPVTVQLGRDDDAAKLGLLEVAPGVGARWVAKDELGAFVDQHASRSPWVSPPLHTLLDKSGLLTGTTVVHSTGRTGKGVVVGVIDTGLDLTHLDLRDPKTKKTRVAWLLDLSASPYGKYPEVEKAFGCTDPAQAPCGVLAAADIDERITKSPATLPTDSLGHGTHVASISAGNGGAAAKLVGGAPEATLVVARVTRDSGGGSITDVDILNAVRFVFDRAEALKMPAVANVSLGGDFGPHDGTSLLEQGLASFVGPDHPGRALVVAAGNSAGILKDDSLTEYGVHTEVRTIAGATTRAILKMPVTGERVTGTAYAWINFRPGDDVRVGVERNGTVIVGPFGPGEQGATTQGVDPYVAVIHGVLGAASPINPGTRAAVVAIDGTWRSDEEFAITMEGDGTPGLWVQGTGDAEQGSAYGGMLFVRPTKQGTINVPASHPDLLSVGCTLNRLSWDTPSATPGQLFAIQVKRVGSLENPPPDSVCYFSSAGPNADGVPKPEISAPGGFVAAAMSQAADPRKNPHSMFVAPATRGCPEGTQCYMVDETHAIASGTSMSAPQVAGAVALLLERDPTLTEPEIVALLQAGARSFSGIVPYDFQLGPGALSIDGAFAALDDRGAPKNLLPDGSKSWMHLSVGYARPDPSWPVVATLELRSADGLPADGFDARRLTVDAPGAQVLASLSRIAPGLYRVKLAAPEGTGGQTLRITALFDGKPFLPTRTLTIAPDPWLASDPIEVKGGCAVTSPTREAGEAGPWAALGLFATLASVRSRRRRARG